IRTLSCVTTGRKPILGKLCQPPYNVIFRATKALGIVPLDWRELGSGTMNEAVTERPTQIAFEADASQLPLSYGSDRLVLMARDPTWAHAYWDIRVPR